MKKWFWIIAILLFSIPASARHIAGGELFYQYVGPGPLSSNGLATSVYKVTLRLFRDCASPGPVLQNEAVVVGAYNAGRLVNSVVLPLVQPVSSITLNTAAFPCLTGNVNVCFEIGIYSATMLLENNADGYILSRTGCCRVDNISNLSVPTSVGSNYVTKIPGTILLPTGHNSSPVFNLKDTSLICANKKFVLDFGASDADNDSLSYSFCEGYTSASSTNNQLPSTALTLYGLPYIGPYSGAQPLGATVTIDSKTGSIKGTAPVNGYYVVSVCITEWRNGIPFNEHRKDFILQVKDCDIIEADLPDKIVQCDSLTVHFENQSPSSAITAYSWDFGDGSAVSHLPVVNHAYADTGKYRAILMVTGPRGCVGADTTTVLVYPGFKPGFKTRGSCYLNPFSFIDTTHAGYGTVSSWQWDFGDLTTTKDTSTQQNPSYQYSSPVDATVRLIVSTSKGCIDTVQHVLPVREKPLLSLPFRDTLICSIDTLAIPVDDPGVFSWSPNYNIINPNTSSPLVYPKVTTQYVVTVTDQSCFAKDSLTVRVLDFITVNAGKDSTLCAGDSVRLHAVSEGLGFHWQTSTGVAVDPVKSPLVNPSADTYYYILANLGKCIARDTVFMKVYPYPFSDPGPDTTICFGSRYTLHGNIRGAFFEWSPAASLSDPHVLNPIAIPAKTTTYYLRVTDTIGCPKPFTDSVIITVGTPVIANAGRDTAAVVNQPLQLNATGGVRYLWSPETGLSDVNVPNPIVTLDERFTSMTYRVRVFHSDGCYADDDVTVLVYASAPDIFVPSAFTPDGDGKNDVLRPVTYGISMLRYFSVYNRWGQLLFTTTELGKGWDGTFNGVKQASNTYVYITEGVDYLGKTVYRKGTAVLIR